MAAVQYAARRLGGSLLQRTQAAITEEGRRLAPSRLMGSRELSSKVSVEHARNIQKNEDDIWAGFKETLKRTRAVRTDHHPCVSIQHAPNIQKKDVDIWAGFKETLKRTAVVPKKRKPSAFQQRMMFIEGVTKTLAYGAFKVGVVFVAACAAFDR